MAIDKELKDLWVQWTHDAISKYVPPEKIENAEELVDDMIAVASQYASGMLDEFEETFGPKGRERSGGGSDERRSRRRKDPERDGD